ncbi:hypothetical protein SAMN05444007_105163 [Cribrihabitans marinus]|uniref:Uncharacterized protein n=1 Tax=Cribrihabitans marinus TaxID=1227549 RepID=A0A1H6ZVE8_9RHOB|nr:hypothetical protein [Cribrihabitans marinus]GGH30515.1 hypothetical protein GCM10010973_20730 [Cribrihabitans marinus]SEJ53570.1 hypothetical protein SAMN05444007_105163 [Cribrihabitans marinus]
MQDTLSQYWPILVLGGAAVLAVAFFLTEDAAVSRRVFRRFFLNIGLPLVVLLGLPLVVLALNVDLEPRLMQALVAGLIIAAGWLTTAIFSELEKARAKAEKTRDYHKALFAEIRHTLEAFYADGSADEMVGRIVERMQADEAFVPFIPKERHDLVYSALVDGIEVLPRQTIDAVVAFYSVIAALQAFAEDMRGEAFKTLAQPRRIAMYEDYAAMRVRAYQLGSYALRLIQAYSEGGAAAAESAAKRFSSPAAGHPGQSPESG